MHKPYYRAWTLSADGIVFAGKAETLSEAVNLAENIFDIDYVNAYGERMPEPGWREYAE